MMTIEIAKERIDHIISIMKRVSENKGNIYMGNLWSDLERFEKQWEDIRFQESFAPAAISLNQFKDKLELNPCGTAACMVGWCAIDPVINSNDSEHFYISDLVKFIVDDSRVCCEALEIYEKVDYNIKRIALFGIQRQSEEIYGKKMEEITAEDIIEKLEELKEFL